MTVLIQGTSLVLMPWDLIGGTLVFIVILACQENSNATAQRKSEAFNLRGTLFTGVARHKLVSCALRRSVVE